MMKIKYYPVFGGIRVLETEGGHLLFCANDVAASLAYKDPGRAVRRHCSDGFLFFIPTGGGKQATKFIDETDVRRLIIHAGNEQAEALLTWLLGEFPSLSPAFCKETSEAKEKVPTDHPENGQLLEELQSIRQELNELKIKVNSLTMEKKEPMKEIIITLEEFCTMLPKNQQKHVVTESWFKSLFTKKPTAALVVPSFKNVRLRVVILDK